VTDGDLQVRPYWNYNDWQF